MKLTTNLQAAPPGSPVGVGLPQGSILEIYSDEECVYISSEVMTEYAFVLHTFKGAPIVIDQEDNTTVDRIRLDRKGQDITGRHLLKVVAYGIDKQQAELDIEFMILPRVNN